MVHSTFLAYLSGMTIFFYNLIRNFLGLPLGLTSSMHFPPNRSHDILS